MTYSAATITGIASFAQGGNSFVAARGRSWCEGTLVRTVYEVDGVVHWSVRGLDFVVCGTCTDLDEGYERAEVTGRQLLAAQGGVLQEPT